MMRPRPFPAPSTGSSPRRIVVAIPPGELLLEVALNLLPLAEAGTITLVLQPDYSEHDHEDPGLVIRKAANAGRRLGGCLLEVVDPDTGGHSVTVRWDAVVSGGHSVASCHPDGATRGHPKPAAKTCQSGNQQP
ncbi:MAG: hypothetical protein GXP47_01320 [Acidobacteria bacterium]|nr:hypothetical protein [Acidobacteriota bacterium]